MAIHRPIHGIFASSRGHVTGDLSCGLKKLRYATDGLTRVHLVKWFGQCHCCPDGAGFVPDWGCRPEHSGLDQTEIPFSSHHVEELIDVLVGFPVTGIVLLQWVSAPEVQEVLTREESLEHQGAAVRSHW